MTRGSSGASGLANSAASKTTSATDAAETVKHASPSFAIRGRFLPPAMVIISKSSSSRRGCLLGGGAFGGDGSLSLSPRSRDLDLRGFFDLLPLDLERDLLGDLLRCCLSDGNLVVRSCFFDSSLLLKSPGARFSMLI
ncbi:unnamed protein product [Linum trigynum]|uniref:Uncharacterized protein n=1 Tax=Linum trigynum TaxID=586398 RepID=A0AAV2DVF8_9ROSI